MHGQGDIQVCSAEPRGAGASVGTLRILLVGERNIKSMAIARILEAQRHTVWAASSATDAMIQFATETADVVFIEEQLPDVAGIDLLEGVAEMAPTSALVFVCESCDLSMARRLAHVGVADILAAGDKKDIQEAVLAAVRRAAEDVQRRLGGRTSAERAAQASSNAGGDHRAQQERADELYKRNQELADALVDAEILNRKLRAATDSAKAADQAKSQFLANMSHEIRTPMTAILGFAELLQDDPLSERQAELVSTITRNGNHLLSLINDILDLSKVEAGKMDFDLTRCSPYSIVSDVIALSMGRAKEKGLMLSAEYVGKMPKTIETDPMRLRQILINLIGNAVKFTEEGGVRLVVRYEDEDAADPSLQFDVIDTGIGMSEQQAAKLFRPFSQADASTTRQYGGTGLGLIISRRFAEALGGGVRVVQTDAGIGTRFRATVGTGPMDGVEFVDDPMSISTAVASAESQRACTPNERLECSILLVEDGPDNQRLIGFVLEKVGAQVHIAANGRIGVDEVMEAIAESRPFDIILMDMQMPVMSGYEATELLRAKGVTTPIIALTAHAMSGSRDLCLRAGCDAFATKPINRVELIDTIRRFLKNETKPGR